MKCGKTYKRIITVQCSNDIFANGLCKKHHYYNVKKNGVRHG